MIHPTSLALTEQMRIEAVKRLSQDEELDCIEQELRRDLHGRGATLSWDTMRRGQQGLAYGSGLVFYPGPPPLYGRMPDEDLGSLKAGSGDATCHHPSPAWATPPPPLPSRAPAPPYPPQNFAVPFEHEPLASRFPLSTQPAPAVANSNINSNLTTSSSSATPNPTAALGAASPDVVDMNKQTAASAAVVADDDAAAIASAPGAEPSELEPSAKPKTTQEKEEQASADVALPFSEPTPAPGATAGNDDDDSQSVQDPDLDNFGEDAPPDVSMPRDLQPELAAGVSEWVAESQIPWQWDDEKCTLTILQNRHEKLLRFEILKLHSGETLYITCTEDYFDELCGSQSPSLRGPARINAATRDLLGQALEEQQLASNGALSPLSPTSPSSAVNARAGAKRAQSFTSRLGEATDDDVIAFGNAFGHVVVEQRTLVHELGPTARAQIASMGRTKLSSLQGYAEHWSVVSQESITVGEQSGTCTTLRDDVAGDFRFEFLRFNLGDIIAISAKIEDFERLEDRQESAGMDRRAVLTALFEESLQNFAAGAN